MVSNTKHKDNSIFEEAEKQIQKETKKIHFPEIPSNLILFFAVGACFLLLFFLLAQSNTLTDRSSQLSQLQNSKAELEGKLNLANQNIKSLNTKNSELINALGNLQNEFEKLRGEYDGAQVPPYTVAKGREFKTVFKKRNEDLVYWTVPADSIENSFARAYYKQKIVPTLIPGLYTAHNNIVNYCNTIIQISGQYYDQCKDIIEEDLKSIKKTEDLGPKYLDLKIKKGGTVKVIDFTEYVEPNAFTKVIDTIYDPKKSDEENIREIANITAQLTSYSFEFEETPRYPLVTVAEGGGDCEDTAILVASLLKAVPKNWKVELVYMDSDNPSNAKTSNHVIVYVDTGEYKTFIETTNQNGVDYWNQTIDGWYFEV